MTGRHRKPRRNPAPILAAAAATALLVPGVLTAATRADAAVSHEIAPARVAQPSWWHGAHLAHLAHLGQAAIVTQAPGSRTTGGKTWGVSYGYPNYCGDGDGDGYDIPCSQLHHDAAPAPAAPRPVVLARHAPAASHASSGSYSYAGLEQLWISAGGPSWAAAHAASIAECESGGNTSAYNPSGATGLWQILGAVVPGNLNDPSVNAANAVSKFTASGGTFAQWVCQ